MDGLYLFGIRYGQHPSLIASAEDTERGRGFLAGRYHYWLEQKQGWDILFLLRIDRGGNTWPAYPYELE